MFSKVFLAYILMALGAVPAFLVASPAGPADADAPGTVAHTPTATLTSPSPSAAHVAQPVISTDETNSATAGRPPANNTAVSRGGNSTETVPGHHESHTNGTSAAPPGPESPPTTTCFPKSKSHGIEDHHCYKAIEKVVFAANQTLDKFSSLIFANYKTCNVHIRKAHNGTLKKVELSAMVHNLTAACHSTGGVLSQSSKRTTLRIERATKSNTYDVDNPVCKKEQCPLTPSDCLSAFYQLPVNARGIFVNGKENKPFARVTSGNCTVTVSTTDLSAFSIPRQFVAPTMKKLVKECGDHPGKIFFSGGTKGYNGDIWLSARAADKKLCH